jgi:hypothetical protein
MNAVDPRITQMWTEKQRMEEQMHVASITGQLGDQSKVPLIELPLAGGSFRFRLTELELTLLELGYPHPASETRTKAPPIRVSDAYARLLRGRYEVDGEDVGVPGAAGFSVIEMNAITRMALLGGGGGVLDGKPISWKDCDVDAFMVKYVYPLPLIDRWNLAVAALGVRMQGAVAPGAGTDG